MLRYLKKSFLKDYIINCLKCCLLLVCFFLVVLNFKIEVMIVFVSIYFFCIYIYVFVLMKGVMYCFVCFEDSLFVLNVKGLFEFLFIVYDLVVDFDLFLVNYIVIGLIVIVMYFKLFFV